MPGGLAYAVIFVGAILGAITGTVAASVIAMGMISLPVMMRYGYDMRIATGVIAASGTITQVIPPSLVLIVLADQLGVSVGDMYLGAIGPSILQVALFVLFIPAVSMLQPQQDAAAAAGGAHAAAAGRSIAQGALGHGALARADLPRARHDLPRASRRRPRPAPWARSARSCWPCCTAASPAR